VVECTALEMRHRCKPIGGSNPSLSASAQSVRLGKPFRSEGCHAKAHRAKAGCAARELRPGRPACDHLGKDSRKADAVLAPNYAGMAALPAKTF
jgi:hypothetical protein